MAKIIGTGSTEIIDNIYENKNQDVTIEEKDCNVKHNSL